MIKALHFVGDLDTAGLQTVVMSYLRHFHEDKDIDMTVAVMGNPKGTPYEKESIGKNYKVDYLGYKPCVKPPFLRTVINWFRCQRYIYKEIKKVKPDVVHSHGTGWLPYVIFPALLCGIKGRVHTLHSDPYTYAKGFVFWAKVAYKIAGVFPVCVTEGQAEKAKTRYGIKKYQVIKNGIDKKRFDLNERKTVREEIGIKDDTKVIGCVGRLDKIKNHPFLIKVFAEYQKENENSVLVLIGEGNEHANLQQLAFSLGVDDKVLFLGLKNDVERYYFAMDVFMLTSFFESSSIVTVEAQYAGLKCVIANSIPENVVVSDKVNRLPLDAPISQWVAAIKDELPHDKQVGNPADFSLETSIDDLKSLYIKLIK